MLGIGDEDLLAFRSGIPEHFGDIPRAVSVVDQQAVALRLEASLYPQQRFRGGALQESPGLIVKLRAHKIVGCGIADVQVNGAVQRLDFHQIRC